MAADFLRIEIRLVPPDRWQVRERSDSTVEAIQTVVFDQAGLEKILERIRCSFLGVPEGPDPGELYRLGHELSHLILPRTIREKLLETSGAVEFFLDTAAVVLPVELFPGRESVLAAAVPVSRHWLYEHEPDWRGRQQPGQRVFILANPAGNLPGAQQEGKALSSLFRRSRQKWLVNFLGGANTREKIDSDFKWTDLLHLAAHHHHDSTSAGLRVEDGLWMPSDFSWGSPRFVFANCCRAALVANGDADELSLVGEFLRHGTEDVVAPYLPVPDAVARVFADAFYASFLSGTSPAQAAWEARTKTGPAGWMYWHFGCVSSASRERAETPAVRQRSVITPIAAYALIGCALLLLAAAVAVFLGNRPPVAPPPAMVAGDASNTGRESPAVTEPEGVPTAASPPAASGSTARVVIRERTAAGDETMNTGSPQKNTGLSNRAGATREYETIRVSPDLLNF